MCITNKRGERMKPKVSVIIPSYGGSNSIISAVNSVLNQTYDNYEVIVVDDNNPETEERRKTEGYMKKFSANEKVKYIKHSQNKGGSAARNTGVANSKGVFICLLDDDDLFLPEKLEMQVDFLETHPEHGACYCWRKQNGRVICGEEEGDLSEALLDLSFTTTTDAIMIRRECYLALNGFDESYRRHQDFEFMLRFYKIYSIGVVKKVLIEIVGNDINNQPKGEKLYEVKRQFFCQFGEEIERINKNKKGYRKKVYAEHFARAFKEMLRHGNLVLAVKIYFEYGYRGGFQFWKVFFNCCFLGMKERMER